MGEVTSLLAGHLADGGVVVTSLLALSHRLPEGFVRFCAASSAGLALVATLLGDGVERFAWLLVAAVAALVYARARRPGTAPKALAVTSVAVGVFAAALFALLSSDGHGWLAVAGSVSSALLLGAVTVTMILGHWYLVDTSLSIAPLRDGAFWLWLSVLARWAVVGLALALGGWEVLHIGRAADLVFSTRGLFFLFRSLTGLLAPVALAALVWQTVKIRSTQSATGLLYVALMLVLFGELISQFLLVTTGYPL
jgi:hypothetical protein